MVDVPPIPSVFSLMHSFAAHELGHWYYLHPTKLLCLSQLHIFTILALFPAFLNAPPVLRSFGFPPQVSAHPPTMVAFLLFQVCIHLSLSRRLFYLFVFRADDLDTPGSIRWNVHERSQPSIRMASGPFHVRAPGETFLAGHERHG